MLSRSDAKIADWVEKGKVGAPQDRFQNQWPNCLGHSVGGRGLSQNHRALPLWTEPHAALLHDVLD